MLKIILWTVAVITSALVGIGVIEFFSTLIGFEDDDDFEEEFLERHKDVP